MNPVLDVKRYCERRLNTLGYPTAYENVSFTPPQDQLYLSTQFGTPRIDDPVYGDLYHREVIQFQVFVVDLKGIGTANAIAKAEEVRSLFYRGLTAIESSTRMSILKTPQIAGNSIVQGRLVVPVLITIVAEINN